MAGLFTTSDLMARDARQATDELIVEGADGDKITEEKSKVKQKKKDEAYLIQVTAQKRKQNIQDVPSSVSALNVKQIQDAGITSTNEVHNYVPNFSSFDFGSGFSYYSIRGQSNAVQYANSVGIYIDDVPLVQSGNVTDSGLYEIERIEVLRGAQGNLYGLNSAGGVVNIITTKPDNFWISRASASYGNYNLREYNAALSGPVLKDTLFVGFAGTYKTRDSYIDELGADTHKVITMAGRYQVRYTPVKELDILFTANLNNREQDFGTFTIKDDDLWESLNKGMTEKNNNKGDTESLRIKYYTPWFDITSVTGRAANEYECDQAMDLTSGGSNLFSLLYEENAVNWEQELRLNSNNKKSSLQWIAGVFYLNSNSKSDCNMPADSGMFAAPYTPNGTYVYDKTDSEVKGNSASVFGQADYTFFERLTLTAGMRYDYDRKEIDFYRNKYGTVSGDFEDSKSWHVFSPRVSVDFRLHESVMTYVSAASGYKAGGYSPVGSNTSDTASFDPEYSWTFEGGFKTNWWNNRIIANIAGFYSMIDDVQIMIYDPATSLPIYQNAAKAHNAGLEIETIARPVKGLEIMASFGYLFSEFREHEVESTEGNRVPFAPEYQAGVALQYVSI